MSYTKSCVPFYLQSFLNMFFFENFSTMFCRKGFQMYSQKISFVLILVKSSGFQIANYSSSKKLTSV